MKMSYVRNWIHAVWGTKSRQPYLTKEVRGRLFSHIKENAKGKGIHIDCINGYLDHVHCLIALNADRSIAETMQLIKGESSRWANKNKVLSGSLEWADDYFAVSVSESQLDKVRAYIINQEEHHRKVTFAEEYEAFIKKYKFDNQG